MGTIMHRLIQIQGRVTLKYWYLLENIHINLLKNYWKIREDEKKSKLRSRRDEWLC